MPASIKALLRCGPGPNIKSRKTTHELIRLETEPGVTFAHYAIQHQ
jgi:hypothetical protein